VHIVCAFDGDQLRASRIDIQFSGGTVKIVFQALLVGRVDPGVGDNARTVFGRLAIPLDDFGA